MYRRRTRADCRGGQQDSAQSQFRVTQPNYISTAGFPRKNGLDNVSRREERERERRRQASERDVIARSERHAAWKWRKIDERKRDGTMVQDDARDDARVIICSD